MSRHRDVRNLEAEDFESDYDYGSSYSSSYCDEVPLSASVERDYIFRRNASGTTPKLTHFFHSHSVDSVPEEDEADPASGSKRPANEDYDSDDSSASSGSGHRHSSGSSLLETLSEEEQKKLAVCLDEILDIVGESMPEIHIKEAIVKCDFHAELALNTLLNNPSVFNAGQDSGAASHEVVRSRRKQHPRPTNLSPPPVAVVTSSPTYANATPALPCTTVTSPAASLRPNVGLTTSNTTVSLTDGLSKKRLEIRSRTPSPSSTAVCTAPETVPSTAPSASSAITTSTPAASSTVAGTAPVVVPGSAVKMRKKEVNVKSEFDKVYGPGHKNLLNLVVVGHVDSGKSTLMGHLLFRLGCISSRLMHKYENESKKLGKQSFAYAWVLDETDEERSRGITMDVGQNRFVTKTKTVILLDAPGHRDFIPNMISGAYQADVAVLVVNATRGEFEAGFDSGGQTREHAQLVRSLGVTQLIVAVNKLDTVQWSADRFEEICATLKTFLKQVGFKDQDVTYVPCSGLTGINLTERVPSQDSPERSWMANRQSLLEAIDGLNVPDRAIDKPFRMCVSDVFKGISGFCVSGRIESGFVMPNDKVLLQPLNELAMVKLITRADDVAGYAGSQIAFCGEHVSLVIGGVEQANVSNGMVLCDPQFSVPVSRHFQAKVVVFNVDQPIIKGTTCVLHYGSVQCQATVKKIVGLISKSTGQLITGKGSKPRCLTKNTNAIVEIKTDAPICIELYTSSKEMGRFMLRSGGTTISAGIVTHIF